jgi:hypothetical protein
MEGVHTNLHILVHYSATEAPRHRYGGSMTPTRPKGPTRFSVPLLFVTCYHDTRTHTGGLLFTHYGIKSLHHTRHFFSHDIRQPLSVGIHASGGSRPFARNMLYHWEIGRTSAMHVDGNVVWHRGCGTQPAVVIKYKTCSQLIITVLVRELFSLPPCSRSV